MKMIPCACGCGELIPEYDKGGRKRRYVSNHNRRGKRYYNILNNKNDMAPCACGCGELIKKFDMLGGRKRYINGHRSRTEKYNEMKENKMIPCACGCGELILKYNSQGRKLNYVPGHQARTERYHEKMKHRMIPCGCGCGELIPDYDKYGNKRRYVFGHSGIGKKLTDEHIENMRIALTGKKRTKEQKAKLTGKNSVHWKGGISFLPYCHKFNHTFREKIRKKFNRKCFICDKPEADNNGRKLSVHHVQYQKNCGCDDTLKCDYVPLCGSCHAKTNHNRNYWEKKISSKLNPDINYHQPKDIKPLTKFFK